LVALWAFAASVSGAQAASAGSLDRSFGHSGRVLTDFFGGSDRGEAMALQGKGRVVLVGEAPPSSRYGVSPRVALARYRPRGRLDRSFGHDGRAILRRCDPEKISKFSSGEDVAVQPNGKIVVAGICGDEFLVARFSRDGELDRSFGVAGKATIGTGPWSIALGLAIQPDGKLVAAGYTWRGYVRIVRYRRNGSLDPSFDGDGKLVTALGQESSLRAYDIAVEPDGRLVIAGSAGNNWMVARFLADGSPDSGFGEQGVQVHGPVSSGYATSVAIQPDGKIVAAGTTSDAAVPEPAYSAFGLVRYLPDGNPDPAFGDDGAQRTTFIDRWPYNYGGGLALQADGKIVMAGTASLTYYVGRHARLAVARYRPNGRLDQGFAGDGKDTTNLRPEEHHRMQADLGRDVVIQPRGRIVAGGVSSPWSACCSDFALAGYLGTREP